MKFEISALVLGIVQALKLAGFPPKYSPLLAPVLGSLINIFVTGYSPEALINGVGFGLVAIGLYEGASLAVHEVNSHTEQE